MLYEMPHQEWQQLQPLRPLPGFQMLMQSLRSYRQEVLESLPLLESPELAKSQGMVQFLNQFLLVLDTEPPKEDVVEESVETKPRHNGAL